MLAILVAFVVVWLLFFVGWGFVYEVTPPGAMGVDEYTIQYVIVGAVVCLVGAIAAKLWFSACESYRGHGSLSTKYRTLMALPLVVGCAGTGYLVFLGAGDAVVNYVLTLFSGLIVYIVAACMGTPVAGKKVPPFG